MGEVVETMRSEEEDVIDKMQPEAGLLESGVKEVLFKLMNRLTKKGVHGNSLNLEATLGVYGETIE